MEKQKYLGNADIQAIEKLYEDYKSNPKSVNNEWQKFFEGFDFAKTEFSSTFHDTQFAKEFNVIDLINDYRKRGHLFTKTNPVRTRRKYTPSLELENYGLSESDLNSPFMAGNEIGIGKASLKEIISHLEQTYCQSIGVEFMYIRQPEIVDWLEQRMESTRNTPNFSESEKIKTYQGLYQAVAFESFIHKKFPGQKRFSLQGAESLIPALNSLIENGESMNINEFVIGMAHRGRLNVLANVLHKNYNTIFSEFEGKQYDENYVLGDVKYHLGYTSDIQGENGTLIHVSLAPNPSHLEAVNPVVEGIVRAKIDNTYNNDNKRIVPVLIHGDASISGQGVVYEVVQMANLDGYKTGGTIHLVINNQLGFTTNYLDGRSSTYCTDIGKVIQSPIFHVNADDVEAVVLTIKLAIEFRQRFKRDVFIDLLGYRRYGHNESDEPRFTQPLLYKIIEKHEDSALIYQKKLLSEKSISSETIESIKQDYDQLLESELQRAKMIKKAHITPFLSQIWENYRRAEDTDFETNPDTSISLENLDFLIKKISLIPDNIKLFKKLRKLHEDRMMLYTSGKFDWAMGELLAYASLLQDGFPIRLSGQDVERGTFSHRHAVLKIEDSEEEYIPLNNISENQAPFMAYNSLLSEYGVLGFDYGYAMASPKTLTIWEAQFGDFANGAQIIFDQFISSAEDKWKAFNGLVVMLPHGFEGQGSEHSSARIERYLTLCAENNLQIANCSTPANLFHILRRQMMRPFTKPLILFTPKSLLRHPNCTSEITEFTNEKFNEVIDDKEIKKDDISKIIFCSGKIFYDLSEYRKSKGYSNVAIIRIEQIYPFPKNQLKNILKNYPKQALNNIWWLQEEPYNMGALAFMRMHWDFGSFKAVSRPPSGSPASGSSMVHKQQQTKILEKAFDECACEHNYDECKMQCINQ